jgi:hypothetical protein
MICAADPDISWTVVESCSAAEASWLALASLVDIDWKSVASADRDRDAA